MRTLAVGLTLILFAGKLIPFGGLETASWWLVFSPIFAWLGLFIACFALLVVVKVYEGVTT